MRGYFFSIKHQQSSFSSLMMHPLFCIWLVKLDLVVGNLWFCDTSICVTTSEAQRLFLYSSIHFERKMLEREAEITTTTKVFTLRQDWKLCDALRCSLTNDVCVFKAKLGQTKQTKPDPALKTNQAQNQQTDLKIQKEDKITKTRIAFTARHRRFESSSEVISDYYFGNWLAKKNRSAVGEAFGW